MGDASVCDRILSDRALLWEGISLMLPSDTARFSSVSAKEVIWV